MISSHEALRKTEEAYAAVRAEEIHLDLALRSRSQEAARLRRERLKQLRCLAELKFEHIKSGALIAELDAAEQNAKNLLESGERELQEATKRRHEALEALENVQRVKDHQELECVAAQSDLRSFEERSEPTIAAEPDFVALKDLVDETRRTLQHAERKAQLAEIDRQKKRMPYEQDQLFMYLWERKFGSSDYKPGSFVRFFDALVAEFVGYREASANYSLLNQIPDRLREHVDRVRGKLELQQRDLEAFRQELLQKAGSGPLQARVAETKLLVEDTTSAVLKARESFEIADREYASLIGRNERGIFNQAIEEMAKSDSRSDISALYAEAERTGNERDRAIVARIDDLTKAISVSEKEIEELRQRLRSVVARRADIQRAHAEATITEVLGGIVAGVVSGAVLGQVLQGHDHAQGPLGPASALGQLTPPSCPSPPPIDSDANGGFSSGGGF